MPDSLPQERGNGRNKEVTEGFRLKGGRLFPNLSICPDNVLTAELAVRAKAGYGKATKLGCAGSQNETEILI